MVNDSLFKACQIGDANLLKEILLNAQDLNVIDSHGWAPLHYASENGYTEIVALLLNSGADANLRNSSGYTPYQIVMMCEHYNIDLIRILHDAGAMMGSILHTAILLNQEEKIAHLISRMEFVNSSDELGNTPLHIAVNIGRNDLIIPLINAGARVNKGDIFSSTPLHECSAIGDIESVKILLSLGADTNMRDYNGRNSLILAAGNGHIAVVKSILNFGVDIDLQDNFGNTALHYAYENEEYLIVKTLIEHNASTLLLNEDELSPEQMAP